MATWTDRVSDDAKEGNDIVARRYSSNGQALGDSFVFNTDTRLD